MIALGDCAKRFFGQEDQMSRFKTNAELKALRKAKNASLDELEPMVTELWVEYTTARRRAHPVVKRTHNGFKLKAKAKRFGLGAFRLRVKKNGELTLKVEWMWETYPDYPRDLVHALSKRTGRRVTLIGDDDGEDRILQIAEPWY